MSSEKHPCIPLLLKGYSYKQIQEELNITKSTINYWFKKLPKEKQKEVKAHRKKNWRKSYRKYAEAKKKETLAKEEKIQRKHSEEIKSLTDDQLFWLGMGLYMAEGSKTERWKSTFYNSNPALNSIMMKFFRKICQVPTKRTHIQLVLHKNINAEKAITYWSKILEVPKKNFYRPSFVESSSSKNIRPENKLKYGTVQISITGKKTTHKIKGWMKGIKEHFA